MTKSPYVLYLCVSRDCEHPQTEAFLFKMYDTIAGGGVIA